MSDADDATVGLSAMGVAGYDGERLLQAIAAVLPGWRVSCKQHGGRLGACQLLVEALDRLSGVTLQDRWEVFEQEVWPAWVAGRDRPAHHHWSYGIWTLVMARAVRPGWSVLIVFAPGKWLWPLPDEDPLRAAAEQLREASEEVVWSNARMRAGAVALGLRIMLARGYGSPAQITSADLQDAPTVKRQRGIDTLDAALCALGILERSPQRGATRQQRVARASVNELVARADVPERFRAVTALIWIPTPSGSGTLTLACATRPPTWRAFGGSSPSGTPSLAAAPSCCPRTGARSCRSRLSRAAPRNATLTMGCA